MPLITSQLLQQILVFQLQFPVHLHILSNRQNVEFPHRLLFFPDHAITLFFQLPDLLDCLLKPLLEHQLVLVLLLESLLQFFILLFELFDAAQYFLDFHYVFYKAVSLFYNQSESKLGRAGQLKDCSDKAVSSWAVDTAEQKDTQ